MSTERLRSEPLVKLASGGMATVYVGTLRGDLAFRRLVAIKRPHPHLVEDPELRAELLLEARLASRIHHANVVEVRDVEAVGESLQLVMDYVEGASLGELILAGARLGGGPRIPPGVAVRIALDACAGLHAAHELTDEAGAPIGLVHRDVSPQNILVGLDGIARVADFGLAKESLSTLPRTATGVLRGKIGYLAPEYVRGKPIDRRADVFAMGVVLWEALTHKRLFRGSNEAEALERVLREEAPLVSTLAVEAGTALDAVVARALAKSPDDRWPSARELGDALEACARPAGLVASHADVAKAVEAAVGDAIRARRERVREALARIDSDAKNERPPEVAAPRVEPAPPPRRRVAYALAFAAFASTAALAVGAFTRHETIASPPPASAVSSAPSSVEPVVSSARGTAPLPIATSTTADTTTGAPTASSTASTASTRAPVKRSAKPLPPNPYR